MTKISRNFTAGRMNKVVDERLVPDGEYVDAMNIRMGSTENSEIGVIENTKGNKALTTLLYIDGTPLSSLARCIGALDDSKNETVYWFVHDPKFTPNTGPLGSGKLDLIVSYNVFTGILIYHVISIDDGTGDATTLNFNPSYLITGVDKIEDLLFFTDDYNEPRFINVKRSYAVPVGNIDYGGNPALLKEALLVVKKPPMNPVVFTFANTAGQENFMEDRFICFAYRYRYSDGEYSATSQWSEPVFFPQNFQFDLSSYLNIGMENAYNTAIISYETGGPLVKGIDLLYKEMDNNVIKVIEKLDKADMGLADNSTYTYSFTNSKIYTVLPESELLRLYDNVPLYAKAQTIMGNRLMYGNYIEGYDLIDKFGSNVNIDYNTTLNSSEAGFIDLTTSLSSGQYNYPGITTIANSVLSIDFTPIISQYGNIPSGSSISIDLSYISDSFAGQAPFPPSGGTPQTSVSFNFFANRDYSSVTDLATSSEFINAVGNASNIQAVPYCTSGITFTDVFNCSVVQNYSVPTASGIVEKYYSAIIFPSPAPDPVPTGFLVGGPIGITYASNTISFQLPAMLFADNVNSTTTPPTPPTQKMIEYYKIVSHAASFRLISNTKSLHSNRGYEIGIVYMDEFARSSTVLVSRYNTEFVECGKSEKQNSISVTIPVTQRAPYWAKKYKFVCRADKEGYETIYCPLYFNDPDDSVVYFLLEGENARKVENGDRLIVKADANNVPQDCVYATVLEKEAKPYNFITNSPDGAPPQGVYMKIRPDNFSTVKGEDSYIDLTKQESVSSISGNCASLCCGDSYLCSLPHPTIAGEYVDIEIPAGSLVIIQIYFSRLGSGNACEKIVYNLDLEIRAQNNYPDFYSFWMGENIGGLVDSGYKDSPGTINNTFIPGFSIWPSGLSGICESGTNKYQFFEDTTVPTTTPESVYPKFLQLSGTIACGGTAKRKSRVICRIQIYKAEDACVFETMPSDTLPDVFFENNLSYDIDTDGNHLGLSGDTDQDITLGIAGLINTGFFNCYSFGNGVESYKIRDSILGKTMNLGNRVNSVSTQDYKRADRFADITYSGVYNPETNVNKLNEFNLGLLNYKNLEISFGNIYILDGRQTDVLVLQEDKISYVLAGKNLLSDAAAGGAITSVPEVLGTQIARTEKYGISFNPESYVQWGYDRFFTDAKRGAVIQLRGDSYSNEQLKVVSEANMRTWFRDTFINSFNNQKLGGFDPYMNEYVLSGNEIDLPEQVECSDCGILNTFTLETFEAKGDLKKYCVNLGQPVGPVTITYNITVLDTLAPVYVSAVYDGTTYSSGPITSVGSGTINFNKNNNTENTVEVSIAYPEGRTIISVLVSCPEVEYLKIIEVVYTDPVDAGLTTHSEFYYYHYTPSTYISALQSNLVVFEGNDSNPFISRWNETTGVVGTAGFPISGDTMRLRVNQIPPDSFSFNPANNKFLYLRTDTPFSNDIAGVTALYAAASNATPISGSSPIYYADFTVPAAVGTSINYLYLIWDLRTATPVDLCYSDTYNVNEICCNCTRCEDVCTSLIITNTSSVNPAVIVFPSGMCDNQYLEAVVELDPSEVVSVCVVNDNNWYIDSGSASIRVDGCGPCTNTCLSECETWTIITSQTPGIVSEVGYITCDGLAQSVTVSVTSPNWLDICVLKGNPPDVVSGGGVNFVLGNNCGCCAGQPCWYVYFEPTDGQASISYWDCNGTFQSQIVDQYQQIFICINKAYPAPQVYTGPGEKYNLEMINPCNCIRQSIT